MALSVVVRSMFERSRIPRAKQPRLSRQDQPCSLKCGDRGRLGPCTARLQAAYGINNIRFSSIVGDGAGQTIAIVDAYDDPALVGQLGAGFFEQ